VIILFIFNFIYSDNINKMKKVKNIYEMNEEEIKLFIEKHIPVKK
jgi:ethanolamine utilization cobalamin adenosyltransferase